MRDCIVVYQVLLAPGLGNGRPHLLGYVVGEVVAVPRDGDGLPEVDVLDEAPDTLVLFNVITHGF